MTTCYLHEGLIGTELSNEEGNCSWWPTRMWWQFASLPGGSSPALSRKTDTSDEKLQLIKDYQEKVESDLRSIYTTAVEMFLFYFLKLFYCYSITVVCVYPPPLPPPQPNLPSSCFHALLVQSMCPLQLFLKTLPPCPSLSPPSTPLVTVRLFLISMSLFIFCLLFSFLDQVPVKGEIIWYLYLIANATYPDVRSSI